MSGAGSPTEQPIDCHDLRVAVVAASWHQQVMDGLVAGAKRALAAYQVEAPTLVRVPGSFELPVVASALAEEGYDAVVALDSGTAVGFGLLTCDTEEQALDRAGLEGSSEDKGYEATSAALVTAMCLKKIHRSYEADEQF